MTKVKVCGLQREREILWANELLPEYIGFIFAPKSRRYVPPPQARALRALLDPRIRPVGVFVNEKAERAAQLANDGVIDLIQLHGSEDEAYLARLRELTGAPVIQAFRMETPADRQRAAASTAEFVLLDSGSGGTGQAFDWSLVRGLERPYFLTGGLNPQTVTGALEKLHPYGVDVSSGVETGAVKDYEKIKAFIQAVRNFR